MCNPFQLDYFSVINKLYPTAVASANIDLLTEFSWNFKEFSHNLRHFIQFCVLKVQQRRKIFASKYHKKTSVHTLKILKISI